MKLSMNDWRVVNTLKIISIYLGITLTLYLSGVFGYGTWDTTLWSNTSPGKIFLIVLWLITTILGIFSVVGATHDRTFFE